MSDNLIHQYIQPIKTQHEIVNYIINELVYPQIWFFCEIQVYYEVGSKLRDGSYKFTYANWNKAREPQVFLNGSDIQLNSDLYEIDYKNGIITPKFQSADGDNMICSYNFSWFDQNTLASFVQRSMGTINYHGQGATTSYTIKDLPESFYGIAADLCVAMACENLILSTTMWIGKLIFAISSNDLYNGGGDMASQLETIKRNCEDRAYSSLENEKTRAPNAIARPTQAYWRSITMGTGVRPGPHGQFGYGKLRGLKINRLHGMTGSDGGAGELGV